MPPKKQSTLGSFWAHAPARQDATLGATLERREWLCRAQHRLAQRLGRCRHHGRRSYRESGKRGRGEQSSWPTAAIDLTTRADETALNLGSDARTASALSTSARAVVLSLRVEAADGGARAKRNVRPIRPPAGKKRGRAELEDQRAFGGRNGSTWFASANVKA